MSLRHLSIASTATTILLVTVGGLVRATGSGLGCGDDWPGCNGKLLPVLDARPVVIEYSHRLLAMVVGILVVAMVIAAFRERRHRPALVKLSGAALVMVVLQALLGRVVVEEELEALLVVAHLGTALLFLGLLVVITAVLHRADGMSPAQVDRGVSRSARFMAAAVLLLLLVGSYTSDYGYVAGWPLQQGRLIPDLGTTAEAVHYLHRVLAGLVGVMIAVFAIRLVRRKQDVPLGAKFAQVAAGLYALEIIIGGANVWTTLHPLVVTAHLAAGTLIWASLVAVASVTSPAFAASEIETRALSPAGAT